MNDDLVWLFGLEKFFNYINETEKKKFIRNVINLKYSTVELKPWPLKELISFDYLSCHEHGREDRLNFYTNICSNNALTTSELIGVMHSIWPNNTLIKKLKIASGPILMRLVSLFPKTFIRPAKKKGSVTCTYPMVNYQKRKITGMIYYPANSKSILTA